jgi:hypothetical protein
MDDYGLCWLFCNWLPTNLVEIVDYLVFTSTWGSGGRWCKSGRPDQKRAIKPSIWPSRFDGFFSVTLISNLEPGFGGVL